MKLTIKTLQQITFKVDIEPDKSVKELKDKIETDHGKEYPSGSQKLIYAGKILTDDSKLSDYNIDEKKFVVLMITRPPPAPKPQVEKQSTAKKDEPSKPRGSEDKTKPTTQQSSSSSSSSTTTVSTTNTTTPTTTTPVTTNTTQQASSDISPAGGRSSMSANPSSLSMNDPQLARFASLTSQPQFRQLQDIIQQSPHLLSSTIEALAGTDPELYSLISDNPDVFVNALGHPPLAGGRSQSSRGSTTGSVTGRDLPRPAGAQQQAPVPASGGNAGGRQQPVVDQVLLGGVSEHDREAIERLKELGFSEYLAVQAYMACDKDEQLAANLLFQMDQ